MARNASTGSSNQSNDGHSPLVQRFGKFDGFGHCAKASGRVMAFEANPHAILKEASENCNHRVCCGQSSVTAVSAAGGPAVASQPASSAPPPRQTRVKAASSGGSVGGAVMGEASVMCWMDALSDGNAMGDSMPTRTMSGRPFDHV
jgi:hypothetical protein